MKELTIEQKAKRYDEVVKKAESLYKAAEPMSGCNVILETIFPELKESKDEKIKKALIHFISEQDGFLTAINGISVKDILAWLEKQGEQKPTIEMKSAEESLGIDSGTYNKIVDECIYGEQKPTVIIPKFRVGDEIKTSNEESLTITKIDEKGYWSEDLFICGFDEECIWDLVEQKPAWSEEDENRINRLIAYFEDKESFTAEDDVVYANWLKSIKERYTWKPSDEQMDNK